MNVDDASGVRDRDRSSSDKFDAYVLQRRVVKVEARRTVKGASSAPDSVWYGPGEQAGLM